MGFSNVLRLKLVVEIRGWMCCVYECLMLALLNREFPNYCRGMRHLLHFGRQHFVSLKWFHIRRLEKSPMYWLGMTSCTGWMNE